MPLKLKTKIKSKKLNKKLFADLKKLDTKIKAGYPQENPLSHETDQNGFSSIDKAYKINFSDGNFNPYLQISFVKNKIKYQKKFVLIASLSPREQNSKLTALGELMVSDIKETLSRFKSSPLVSREGCLFGSISYVRV